ncbi:hypothetical protein [Paenibacillus harenae]|uniref:hypothetical protein n=1 Tax=Paenibacillus harenae TaxID=306543 RepID=UPI000401D22F|nr:hypothetical protein [Paenibacillus harenae]
MAKDNDRHEHEPHSLVTERDIDPEFGLFTQDVLGGGVRNAVDQLKEKYPEHDVARVHESHVPEALEAGVGDSEADTPEEISEELAAVPDADAVASNSPVDPASPGDEFHGTDLLNGVGNHPEEETEDFLDMVEIVDEEDIELV